MNMKSVLGVACAAAVALPVFAGEQVYKVTEDIDGLDLLSMSDIYRTDRVMGPAADVNGGVGAGIHGPITHGEVSVENPFLLIADPDGASPFYISRTGLADGKTPLAFSGTGTFRINYEKDKTDSYLVDENWTPAMLQYDGNATFDIGWIDIAGTTAPAHLHLEPETKGENGRGDLKGLGRSGNGVRGLEKVRIGVGDGARGVLSVTDANHLFIDYPYLGADGAAQGVLAITNSLVDFYSMEPGSGAPKDGSGRDLQNLVILGPGAELGFDQPLTQKGDPVAKVLFAGGLAYARNGSKYFFAQNDNGSVVVTNEPGCDFVFKVPNANDYRDMYANGKRVTLQGDGNFVKQGAGKLKVAAPLYYTGDTYVEEGRLWLYDGDFLPHTPLHLAKGTVLELYDNAVLDVPSVDGEGKITAGNYGTFVVHADEDMELKNVSASVSIAKKGAGTLTMSGLRGRKLVVDEGKLIVGPAVKPCRYWRFKVEAIRGSVDMMQFSELKLYCEDVEVTKSATVTWDTEHTTAKHAGDNHGLPYPAAETPEKAVDGSVDTKWLDWRAGVGESDEVRDSVWLRFDFGEPIAIDKYEWYTANDDDKRDPKSWRFECSEDGSVWETVDEQENVTVTSTRKVLAYTYESELKAGSDAVLDEIAVAEGAELEVHGVAVKTKRIPGKGSIRLLDGSTLELVADEGALEVVNVSTLSFDETSEIVMNGAGTVKMFGLDGYAGAVTVNTGTLKISDRLIDPAAKWFRWTVKRVHGNNDIMQLSEFSLYDADGNRVNVGMTKAADGTTELQPGEFAQVGAYSVGGNGAEGVDKAFDGNTGTKWCLINVTMNNPGDSSTWRAVVLRLPVSAAPVVAYSFTAGNDSTPARNPSTWVLEASENGKDWVPVDERTDVGSQPTANQTESPIYRVSAFEDASGDEPSVLPFTADATLMVAADATCDLPAPLPNLIVDCVAGAGTLTTFNPAEGGTLMLVNAGETALDGFAVPVTVGAFAADASKALKTWKVMVDGVASPKLRVVVKDGRLTVVKKSGLMIMIL